MSTGPRGFFNCNNNTRRFLLVVGQRLFFPRADGRETKQRDDDEGTNHKALSP